MADDTQPTEAEQAAADALAGVGGQDPNADPQQATDPDPNMQQQVEGDPAAGEGDGKDPNPDPSVPTDPDPTMQQEAGGPINAPATTNDISGEAPSESPEDPGPVDHEEAVAAAVEEAQSIAQAAAENKPDPVEEPAPEPEETEDTTFVVYKAVDGMPYPGLHLTVTIQLDDDENGEPVWESLTLEERVPLEVPVSHATALSELESDHYTIESA